MALLYLSLKKSLWFQSSENQLILLIKAMCLANTAKFFLLPIVIWKTQQSDFMVQLNFLIVIGYFVYGLINVHSGMKDELIPTFFICQPTPRDFPTIVILI